jgi:hypothetical protein
MSYNIQTEVEKDYVRVNVSGEQTLENNIQLVGQILEACAKNDIRKTLIDIRGILGQPGIASDFELANRAAQDGRSLIQKAAVLHRTESHQFTSFFETAIRNRGINLLAFQDEGKAIEWLLETSG